MKILFAGDLSFNYFTHLPSADAALDIMKKTAAYFKRADFSILNLENIFGKPEAHTPITKSGPNLISNEGFCAFIDALSPTVVGLSNNHSRDYGDAPMLATRQMLLEKGYQVIGAGENIEKAYAPALLEQEENKVAIIAVNENEFGSAGPHSAGTAGYHLARVTKAIFSAKEKGLRPIVYFHGGNEYNPFPSPGKVELYRHFVDLGAEAVIAMHTHCPQGYEFYEGCPIVYSMGNFFFPSENERPTWGVGYMVQLTLTADGIELEPIPYTYDFDHHTPMEGTQKERFLSYLAELNAPIDDPEALQAYFDGWCMKAGMKYAAHLSIPLDAEPSRLARLRNNFTCEAHNELICNTLQILFEQRQEEAKKTLPEIERLQNFTF